MKRSILLFILLFCLISLSLDVSARSHEYSLYIDRYGKELYVLKSDGSTLLKTKCGIGRGGLKEKKNMADMVTPTGQFTVDIIMCRDSGYNAVSSELINKYRGDSKSHELVSDKAGLDKLFKNMNKIDFDGNGKPDNAYGIVYIGLNSEGTVTGPKLKTHSSGRLYWFSIALHGTTNEDNIGKAKSGGCIHLARDDLTRLIEEKVVRIGTLVTISDGPPEKETISGENKS